MAATFLVLLAYLPVLLWDYAFLDDYAAFVETRTATGSADLVAAMVSDGRPLYGVIVAAAFGWTTDLADFALLRGWSVLWTLATCLGIARLLCRREIDPWLAAAVGAAWALLPSLQVLVSWAQVGVGQTPAIFLAFCAAGRIEASTRQEARRGVLWLALALALHGAAICVHQAAAMTFWSFLILRWITAPSDLLTGPQRRLFWRGLAVGVAAMALGFLAVRCAPWFGFPPSVRGALLDDPLAKIEWFLLKALPRALQTFSIGLSGVQAGLCLLAYLGGAVLLRRGSKRPASEAWMIAVTLIALMLLCYAPNLVIAQNWPSYRSLVALSSACLFVAVPVLGAWSRAWQQRGSGVVDPSLALRRSRWLAGLVVILLAGKAGVQTATLFAEPQAIEYRVLRDQVGTAIGAGSRPLVGRCAPAGGGIAGLVLGDEFGAVSAYQAWCLRFQIQTALLLAEQKVAAWPIEIRAAESSLPGVHVDGHRLRDWR